MTQSIVRCYQCKTDHGGPRSWKWFCETCAEECQLTHHKQTGHRTELIVVADPSMESLTVQMQDAWKAGW